MKKPVIALAAAAAVVAFAVQVSLPASLSGHMAKLKEAHEFKAKIQVNEIGGAPTTVEVSYAKPNLLRIETPTRLVVSDGKTMTVLDKAKNTYTQTAYTSEAAIAEASETHIWAWAGFFQPDAAKLYKAAKAGADARFRGTPAKVVDVTALDGKTTATLYIETKTGIVKGLQLKTEDKEYVIAAETIAMEPIPASEFTFTPPAGATKLEPGEVGAVGWAEVATIFNRNCMPCHSTAVKSGTLDLSSYQSVSTHRFVVKGEASTSILALSLRASGPKRMPQGRPPLPESQIKTIEAWINGGLKQ